MAENTPNLNLYKANPVVDENATFNIDTMLNENWDKVDAGVKAAEDNAKAYTDQQVGEITVESLGAETPSGAQAKADAAEAAANAYTDQQVGAIQLTAANVSVADTGGNFTSTDVEGVLAELKQYANDGKQGIVTALIGVGQSTAQVTMTFQQLADLITAIANFNTAKLLNDTTVAGKQGTMLNRAGEELYLGYGYMIDAYSDPSDGQGVFVYDPNFSGFIDGTTTFRVRVENAKPENIKAGVGLGYGSAGHKIEGTFTSDGSTNASALLVGYRMYGQGQAIDGAMPNRSGIAVQSSGNAVTPYGSDGIQLTPQWGYYTTSSRLYAIDGDYVPQNWPETINLFGKQGTMPHRRFVGGNSPYALDFHAHGGSVEPQGANIFFRPPKGYYDGVVWLAWFDPELVPSNVKSGVVIGGGTNIVGTFGSSLSDFGLSIPVIAWGNNLGGTNGGGGAVRSNGRLVCGSGGKWAELDSNSGEILSQYTLANLPINAGIVDIWGDGSDNFYAAFANYSTGSLQKVNSSYTPVWSASPTNGSHSIYLDVSANKVFVMGGNVGECYDASTGSRLWQTEYIGSYTGRSNSVTSDGTYVYFSMGNANYVWKYNYAGTKISQINVGYAVGDIATYNGELYVAATNGGLRKYTSAGAYSWGNTGTVTSGCNNVFVCNGLIFATYGTYTNGATKTTVVFDAAGNVQRTIPPITDREDFVNIHPDTDGNFYFSNTGNPNLIKKLATSLV